ncbi:hypothetical protein TVAG_185810 [Trichomonas vaginalis G3]|uniref:Uncharacterized protein n=1 Tax=Trichomonas vaginalis (strain ATCC PRA-98 / G3) TaxID=412133 RepID=A2D8M5_TRIV3|nr:hypothetical protein TVAGG3_0392410 [Trichomonas vaginalis G3]EAY23274.1 hypothetical protein TVAG_185810 [Trichomonas vaginalis G3]KAI5534077.1 hypothetical protein TVAGG3_0392410 [Trichomonas vaginalis G3]|eukprot:XP_001584260.1 hypothetical protein [Trichomonas vaginalis G3]
MFVLYLVALASSSNDDSLEKNILEEVSSESTTVETQGNASKPEFGVYNTTIEYESYYYSLTPSVTKGNISISAVTKVKTISVTQVLINRETPPPTPTLQYKFVFLKPYILVGVPALILFLIGAIYAIFCMRKTSINYANYLKNLSKEKAKNNNRDDDSMDVLDRRPKRKRAATKVEKKPSRQRIPKRSTTVRQHRH